MPIQSYNLAAGLNHSKNNYNDAINDYSKSIRNESSNNNNSVDNKEKEPPSKRRKKPENHIPRPKNPWILYRNDTLAVLRDNPEWNKSQIVASRYAAERWKNETPEVKQRYDHLAEVEKEKHKQKYPGYKYRPRKTTQAKNESTHIEENNKQNNEESLYNIDDILANMLKNAMEFDLPPSKTTKSKMVESCKFDPSTIKPPLYKRRHSPPDTNYDDVPFRSFKDTPCLNFEQDHQLLNRTDEYISLRNESL